MKDLINEEKIDDGLKRDSMSCRASSFEAPDYTEIMKKGKSVTPEQWKDFKVLSIECECE